MIKKLKWQYVSALGPVIGIAGLLLAVTIITPVAIFIGGAMFLGGCALMIAVVPED